MTISFGVSLSTSAAPGADPVRDARRAEALGFDFLTVSDHPHGNHPTFETWTVLTWAAAHTERIGLVPNVLGLPYRLPTLVAKMAESLDRLSGGRVTLGLGAGSSDAELAAMGATRRTPGEKVAALAEGIEVIRGAWSERPFSHHGKYFSAEGLRLDPAPGHHIPIWLGVYGPRAVALAGRVADGWSPSLPYAPPDRAAELRAGLRRAAEEAGRDPDDIVCNYNMAIRVGGRARDERSVAGEPDAIVERLVGFVRMGFTSLSFWPIGDEEEHLPRIAQEILPGVRAAVGR